MWCYNVLYACGGSNTRFRYTLAFLPSHQVFLLYMNDDMTSQKGGLGSENPLKTLDDLIILGCNI